MVKYGYSIAEKCFALGLSNTPGPADRVVALAGSGLHAGVYVQLAGAPLSASIEKRSTVYDTMR